MALDPKAAAIIAYMESAFPQVDTTVSGTEMRRRIAESTAQIGPVTGEQVGQVSDHLVSGPNGTIPVRIYRPEGVGSAAPLAMFFHGGGWVLCDLDSHDAICRAINSGVDMQFYDFDHATFQQAIVSSVKDRTLSMDAVQQARLALLYGERAFQAARAMRRGIDI